jgi:hypothetical protein
MHPRNEIYIINIILLYFCSYFPRLLSYTIVQTNSVNVAVAHVDGIINDHCELEAYYKKMNLKIIKKYVAGHAAPARFGPYKHNAIIHR